MSYSLDLRQKVIDYVERGGKIAKAAKVFPWRKSIHI